MAAQIAISDFTGTVDETHKSVSDGMKETDKDKMSQHVAAQRESDSFQVNNEQLVHEEMAAGFCKDIQR